MLNQSSTNASINSQFSSSNTAVVTGAGSPAPPLALGQKLKLAANTTNYNMKIPRLPSQLESIDEETRSAS